MAEKAKNEPVEKNPVQLGHLSGPTPPPPPPANATEEDDLSDAREVSPFQVIQRGEDTLNSDENVTFADFSPTILPADAPDPLEALPKGESAQEPAPSSVSLVKTEQTKSESPVQTAAAEVDGKTNPNESSKQTSSSPPKSG